ncbi:MAG: hypothetical protein ACRC1K_06660 [Planctomycetia bacterium]
MRAYTSILGSIMAAASVQAWDDADPARFARFRPNEYVRPFGPNAPWNVPVAGLPQHPESDLYVDRLWRKSTAARPGNFNIAGFKDYSYPVYDARDAAGVFKVKSRNPDWGNIHGKTIPWNPRWKQAKGSDGQVIVLDPAAGREWNLWQVRFDGKTVTVGNGSLVDGDYRVKEDGFPSSRGCGIQYSAMLTRPEEVMQGAIRHALSMPIKNPHSRLFVAPATKTDGGKFGIPEGVPEGMRFALRATDAEIDAWIADLPKKLGAETRRSARIVAVALRDYGWIVTDNSGGAFFQFEYDGTAGEKWAAVGFAELKIGDAEYPRDLLEGLLTQERIYAVAPSDQYPRK